MVRVQVGDNVWRVRTCAPTPGHLLWCNPRGIPNIFDKGPTNGSSRRYQYISSLPPAVRVVAPHTCAARCDSAIPGPGSKQGFKLGAIPTDYKHYTVPGP
jgi:hypothetical protein